MDLSFLAAVPAAPLAERIECVPDQAESAYCVVFSEPLTEELVSSINAYLVQHPHFKSAVAVPDDSRSVLVQCAITDDDFEALAWLQRTILPAIPLTGVAQICLKARPVMARITLVGDVPIWRRTELIRQLSGLSSVRVASFFSATNEIQVTFSGEPPANPTEEEALASLLGLQRVAAMTVILDHETIPGKP